MLARYKVITDLTECVNHLSMPNSVYIVHHLVRVHIFFLFTDDDIKALIKILGKFSDLKLVTETGEPS